MNTLLQIGIGGATGALLRHLIAAAVKTGVKTSAFPWPVFIVNLSGCLLIGIIFSLSSKFPGIEKYRLLLFSGILGGYTTFSSFGLETFALWENNQYQTAVVYVLGTNIAGIALVFIGAYLGRLWI